MQFFGLFVAAIVIEGIISYIKMVIVNGKLQWQVVTAIVLGVVVALAYQIDIFAIAGMQSIIPYVGVVLTGILMSRGSNYVYEIIKLITTYTQKNKC